MSETKPVEIPVSLYKTIEKRVKESDFLSVSDFVTQAARKVLSELEEHQELLSEEEKESIKERLKDLGYL